MPPTLLSFDIVGRVDQEKRFQAGTDRAGTFAGREPPQGSRSETKASYNEGAVLPNSARGFKSGGGSSGNTAVESVPSAGLPPYQYVIARPFERAKQLLQGRDLCLADVA